MKNINKLFFLLGFAAVISACAIQQDMNSKLITQGIAVTNNISMNARLGKVNPIIVINGTRIPQYSTMLVKTPISACSRASITFKGLCRHDCTKQLQLPLSCYIANGTVIVNGIVTYDPVKGYSIQSLNCSVMRYPATYTH